MITIANAISVYYAARNSKLTWFFGLFASLLTMFSFLSDAMYLSMLFMLYSAIMCVLGLYFWDNNAKANDETLVYTFPLKSIFLAINLTIILDFISRHLFENIFSFYDSFGTASAIMATYLLYKKDVSCWWFWIVSDITYIVYSIQSNDEKYAIIYGALLCLATYGLLRNTRIYNNNKNLIEISLEKSV